MLLEGFGFVPDKDRPATMRKATGGNSRRPVNGAHLHGRIRRGCRGVKRGVFDVMAHELDAFFAVGFNVE